MDPLTWTGTLGTFLNPVRLILAVVALLASVAQFAIPVVYTAPRQSVVVITRSPSDYAASLFYATAMGSVAILAIYIFAASLGPYGISGSIGEVGARFTPVWIALGTFGEKRNRAQHRDAGSSVADQPLQVGRRRVSQKARADGRAQGRARGRLIGHAAGHG